MSIRAILLDVDGTLTNGEKQIPPRTLRALRQAQDAGILLVLASGRPVSGLMDFARQLGMDRHHGLLVACNGARVADCESGALLFDRPMSPAEGRAVLEHMKRFEVLPMIERGGVLYVNDVFAGNISVGGKTVNIIEYEARGGGFLLCEKRDLAAFADFPLSKILTAGDPAYLAAHHGEMAAPFAGMLNSSFTAPFYYEFTAKDIDKAQALDAALRPLGIAPDALIAFGDSENDLPMLRYAGLGVAMGNAVDALKAAADEVTASNEEEGIAEALGRHLPAVCG